MPMSQSEKEERIFHLSLHFTPAMPINRQNLFDGRTSQIRQVIDAINQSGQHAVLYGERGVGKTSLANMLFPKLQCENVEVLAPIINCMTQDAYKDIWRRVFSEIDFISQSRETKISKATRKIIGDYTGAFSGDITSDWPATQKLIHVV
jgi:Cdc6-like AAA superfamily ATPase